MKGFHRRHKREKAFRRGSQIEEKKRGASRSDNLEGFYKDRKGRIRPITRRKELTPLDLVRSVSKGIGSLRLGSFGINLARGLDTGSKQLGPHVSRLMVSARQRASAVPMPTGAPVPIGQGLDQFDQQVLQQRQIATPQINDPQDVITGGQEHSLQDYVKDALRHMPIGTDTSTEPQVTVVPRAQFHAQVSAGAPGSAIHAVTPAVTTGRRKIMVSDELFDMSPKERRAIIAHETYHALKHFDVYDRQQTPPQWAETEAHNFEAQVEPEGSAAAGARVHAAASRGGQSSMMGMPPMMPGLGR